MGWATRYIEKLQQGEAVEFRPRGNSMTGRVEDRQLCRVEPVTPTTPLQKGDVVLCSVRGRQYLHLIKAVNHARYLIGNNKGGENGWISRSSIYGKMTD